MENALIFVEHYLVGSSVIPISRLWKLGSENRIFARGQIGGEWLSWESSVHLTVMLSPLLIQPPEKAIWGPHK